MSLVDKPFKEAIRALPTKKLSWWADRRIKKMLRHRVAELEGVNVWTDFFKRFVAVPMALVLLITVTGGYVYASPSVVKGDLFYSVKTTIEQSRYPRNGTSEDRIAYHLWLSERRYAEVNEILSRLGKAPLVFIPAARAVEPTGSADDELHQVLLETLQDATQQVDYAFLISDEIRDVQRVKVVKEQIRTSLEKQRDFVKQVTPVLKEVKLLQKKKARVKKEPKPLPSLEEALSQRSEEVLSEPTPAVAPEPEVMEEQPVSSDVQEPNQEIIQLGQSVQNDELVQEIEMSSELPELDEMLDDELGDIGVFLEDRFNYQDTLLQKIDEVIVEADNKGQALIRLTVFVKPLEEQAEITNNFFKEALAVHYENSRKILETELQDLDKELIVDAEIPPVPLVEESTIVPVSESPSSLPISTNTVSESLEAESVVEAPELALDAPLEIPEIPVHEEVESVVAVDEVHDPVAVDEAPISAPEQAPAVTNDSTVVTDAPVAVVSDPLPTEDVSVDSESVPVPPALVADPSVPTSSPEVVAPKTECETRAEERCSDSTEKSCLEKAIKACEENLKQQQEKAERERLQREAWERAEKMKLELKDLEQKMERLQMNFKNSAAPDMKKISDELKASVLKQEQDRKKEFERKDPEWKRNDSESSRNGRREGGR